jgi:diguanylate cyclase
MLARTDDFSPELIRSALSHLELALHHHEQWVEELNATLICRLPPDARDTSDNAHQHCRFGQWYYGLGTKNLGLHEGFVSVEAEHKRMHQIAAQLLETTARGETIPLQDYEKFVSALKRMRLEIVTLRQDLEECIFNIDPLTGAAGRVRMLTYLREQHNLVRRKAQSFSIAMMDLDHFKLVNDKYGHLVGDQVLAGCSHFILSNLRPYDKLFRFGGEEFLICLPNSETDVAVAAIERLRTGLSELPFEANGHGQFKITASFGVTLLEPQFTVEQSIEKADTALYAAKSAGRNCVMTSNVCAE